jgi:hypothetical protein
MSKHPMARAGGLNTQETETGIAIVDNNGREIAHLTSFEAGIWRMADGRTPVQQIIKRIAGAEASSIHKEEVWQALDRLADLGVMAERACPPGPMPGFLHRAILTSATLVGVASLATVTVHQSVLAASAAVVNATDAAHKIRPEQAVGGVPRIEAVKPPHHGKHKLTDTRMGEQNAKNGVGVTSGTPSKPQ